MLLGAMETHGDISGGWIGNEFPELSHVDQTLGETSGVAYADRGVDLGTKNGGIIQFLTIDDLPARPENVTCVNIAECYGACDGHIEGDEEVHEPVTCDVTKIAIGQLALF